MHCMTNARRRMLFGNECPRKKAPRFAPSRRACSSRSPRPSRFLAWHEHGRREHDRPFFFPPNDVAEGGGGAPPRSRGDCDGWRPPILSAHAEPSHAIDAWYDSGPAGTRPRAPLPPRWTSCRVCDIQQCCFNTLGVFVVLSPYYLSLLLVPTFTGFPIFKKDAH